MLNFCKAKRYFLPKQQLLGVLGTTPPKKKHYYINNNIIATIL